MESAHFIAKVYGKRTLHSKSLWKALAPLYGMINFQMNDNDYDIVYDNERHTPLHTSMEASSHCTSL